MRNFPLIKVSVRNGLVSGTLALILFIVLFYIGRNPFLISPFLDFRILLFGVFVFFTLKEFRDYYQAGLLYFWQGLIGSVIVVFCASSIASFGVWIFGKINPEIVKGYIDQMTFYLKNFPAEDIERIGKDVYERNLKLLPATNISTLALTYLFQGMVIGFFISIILSVILRRTT